MSKPMIDLLAFEEKSDDAELLREMTGFAVERVLEPEVGIKTDDGDKSRERLAQWLLRPGLADPVGQR